MVVSEGLSAVGLGSLSMVSASMVVGAIWLWRGWRIASLVSRVLSSTVRLIISLLIIGAVATWAGWLELHPLLLIEDVGRAVGWLLDAVGDRI